MTLYEFSLFKKIKPEALENLYNYLSDSPNLTSRIKSELYNEISVTDLRLTTCQYLLKANNEDYYLNEAVSEYELRKLFK